MRFCGLQILKKWADLFDGLITHVMEINHNA